METAKNYAGLILLIGLAAAATSLLMNLSFAASIGGSGLMLVVLVATWAVFDAAKLSVAYGVGWAWRQRKILLSAFLAILVLVTTLLFSVFSGQAFLAGAFESVNQSRLQNSHEYKRQQTVLDSAERAATAAAVDSSSVQAAQANISTLESDKRQLLNGQAKNMAGNNAGTVQSRIGNCSGTGYYQRTYCSQLQDINAQIAAQGAIVAQGAAYSSALANLERVSSQPTATPITGTHVAGVSSVANLFGLNPQKVQDTITFSMGLVLEAISILFLLLFGLIKGKRTIHQMSWGEIQSLQSEMATLSLPVIPSQTIPQAMPTIPTAEPVAMPIIEDMLESDKAAPNVAAPIAAHKDIAAPNAAPNVEYKGMDRVPAALSKKAGKGRTGKLDTCRDCGSDYIVKTYNATRCESCSEKAQESYKKTQLGSGK